LIEIKQFQCEHCNTVYNQQDWAAKCENSHILYNEIQVIKANHNSRPVIVSKEGLWPITIVVGKQGVPDVYMRYKLEGPAEEDEFKWQDFTQSQSKATL